MADTKVAKVTRAGLAEALFSAESRLRAAAESYTAWCTASNRTAEILNRARNDLRTAAVNYADRVREVERG